VVKNKFFLINILHHKAIRILMPLQVLSLIFRGHQRWCKNHSCQFIFQISVFLTLICLYSFTSDQTLYPYRKHNKWGFCNHDKKIIISCKYQQTYPYFHNLARVRKNNKYGFINAKGEIVIPIIYDEAEDFFYTVPAPIALVKIENKKYWLDTKGNKTNGPPMICQSRSIMISNLNIYKGTNQKCGIITDKWQSLQNKTDTLIQPIYDKLSEVEQSNYFIAINNNCMGVITKTNQIKIPIQYEKISPFILDYEAIFGYQLHNNHLLGFAYNNFSTIIEPQYKSLKQYPNTNLLIITTTKNKIGFIDAKDGTEFFE